MANLHECGKLFEYSIVATGNDQHSVATTPYDKYLTIEDCARAIYSLPSRQQIKIVRGKEYLEILAVLKEARRMLYNYCVSRHGDGIRIELNNQMGNSATSDLKVTLAATAIVTSYIELKSGGITNAVMGTDEEYTAFFNILKEVFSVSDDYRQEMAALLMQNKDNENRGKITNYVNDLHEEEMNRIVGNLLKSDLKVTDPVAVHNRVVGSGSLSNFDDNALYTTLAFDMEKNELRMTEKEYDIRTDDEWYAEILKEGKRPHIYLIQKRDHNVMLRSALNCKNNTYCIRNSDGTFWFTTSKTAPEKAGKKNYVKAPSWLFLGYNSLNLWYVNAEKTPHKRIPAPIVEKYLKK